MLQKIKEKFQCSRVQLLTIYIIQVFLLFSAYLIYKSDNLSDRWTNLSYNSTNFIYTEYEIMKKLQGAYWQLETTIGVINDIFVNEGGSYQAILMCTVEDCFEKQRGNPELDSQYEEIGAYEGLISNKEINSTFGNIGLLLWQFKYSRSGNIESIEIVMESTLSQCTMNLHIPIEEFPKPHSYTINGTQSMTFNPTDIIMAKSFSFVNGTETINGSVSTRINTNKLKEQLEEYHVKMIEKQTGTVYIDNLAEQKEYLTKQASIVIGSMTIEFTLMEQLVVVRTSYINTLFILCFIFMIGLIPIYHFVNQFYLKHITSISSINSILKQKLNSSFNSSPLTKHNLLAINQQLNNLCLRCSQLPPYSINQQKISKTPIFQQQFRFPSKLNEVFQKFKSRVMLSEYQTLIYNNKFIIKINQDFDNEKKVLKELYYLFGQEEFFRVAYLCVCCPREEEYFGVMNGVMRKYTLKKEQKIIFPRFYYRFHARSLQGLRAKINGESEKEIESDKDLADDLCYFEGLHINVSDQPFKGPYFNVYYQKAFFERIQNLILSRFLVFIKDLDKNLHYLKQLGLEGRLQEIELEVDNLRYQMSRKENNAKEVNNP